MLLISVFEKWRQEDQAFKASLSSYTGSLASNNQREKIGNTQPRI